VARGGRRITFTVHAKDSVMNRRLLLVALAIGCAMASLVAWRLTATPAQPPAPPVVKSAKTPAASLPIANVVLFSSGVGYFQREGEVEDAARVDLAFPIGDINDLLKSLVLQDLGGGRISTIGYDSPDPIDKTLKSFSLDLTGNPTFGEILNQARGQKIEATLQQAVSTQPALLTGVIVGMEEHASAVEKEVHQLNLLCAEGMRGVPLAQVQRIRFLDPVVEADFRRALDVLASAHDMQKKVVSLKFNGKGQRTVRVGYVIENPIWKTSYRLVLAKDGKIHLQGWAAVENTTDEDWKDVRMALVSGRPISFQTDLYSPLFVPRPTVEMERFASLRPPEYSGPISNTNLGGVGGGNVGFGGGGLQFGLAGGGMQFGLGEGRYRKRLPENERLEHTQLARPPIQRHGGHALRIAAQARNIIEVLSAITQAEDVHLVLGREMADLIECGDLIPPVRREWDASAYKENSHRCTPPHPSFPNILGLSTPPAAARTRDSSGQPKL